MEIDKWIYGYKVRIFPWVDHKSIYVNVQYFAPGTSISQPPLMDKSALVTDNDAGRRLVYEFTDSCVNYVSKLKIPLNGMACINVE